MNRIYDEGVVYSISYKDSIKYIGSSVNYSHRLETHKSNCYNKNSNRYHSQLYQYIRSNGIYSDYIFNKVKVLNNITKYDLHLIETNYIKQSRLDNLLNKVIPVRSKAVYRLEKKNEISKQGKIYYQQNKTKITQDNINYRKKNKSKLTADYKCDICDCIIQYRQKTAHFKSNKHQENLQINFLHLSEDIFK